MQTISFFFSKYLLLVFYFVCSRYLYFIGHSLVLRMYGSNTLDTAMKVIQVRINSVPA